MNIDIRGLDEQFKRPIDLISKLFFTDCQVTFNKIEQPDMIVTIDFEGEENLQTKATLFDQQTGKTYDAQYKKNTPFSKGLKDWRKQRKHAVNHVYLSVLQQLTGLKQPWGTLTGIRPTKLFHKKVNSGLLIEDVKRDLMNDYLLSNEKVLLMEEIVNRQLDTVPDLYNLKNEVSIYIGIPFCPTKCAYCTFPAYAINGKQGSVDSFLGGLHYEIQEIGRWLKENGVNITTVYFGGGTPTSITADEMDRLYDEMYKAFPSMDNVREVTVEAGRPDTITREKLKVLNQYDIDRISINPQSFIQDTLHAIGRHHTVEETIEKFQLAREMGMNNINMDLIIGLPGEGLKEFQYTLEETKKLMPESLTVHTLSFKRASEMTKNKEKYKVANRDEINVMMNEASKWTNNQGYIPYYLYRQKNILGNLENVGYALKGKESIYNILIMEEQQTILGLGCGAASKFVDPKTGKITRFANPKEPRAYNVGFEYYTKEKIEMLERLFSHE